MPTQPTDAPRWSPHALLRLRERFGIVAESDARMWLAALQSLVSFQARHHTTRRLYQVTDDTVIVIGPDDCVITVYWVNRVQRACLLYELGGSGNGSGEDGAA